MIYGETGITPLTLNIKSRVISYWTRLIKDSLENETLKLSTKIYLTIHELYSQNKLKSQWLDNIKQYLCSSGFSGIWYCQSFSNNKWLIKSSYQRLKDIFIQNWHAGINQTSQTNLYKYIKISFTRAYHLDKLPSYLCKTLIRFFTRNHRLPIEIGRWKNIPANDRKCTNCIHDIGDEFHYVCLCPIFNEDREKYLDRYTRTRPNMQKFINLINTENITKLRKLSIFCGKIMHFFEKQL